MSHLIKAIDPFLQNRKKIDPLVNLDATRQTVLAITDSGKEEASAGWKRASSQKVKGKRVSSKPWHQIPAKSKEEKEVFFYTKNQKLARGASTRGVTKKRRLFLKSFVD